ncbi:MAG TPA: hypothetical protein VGO00_25355, partial [Kofleriaceae bacterium]|nr:hypothetical protein [Kofleriaceae bacterium]
MIPRESLPLLVIKALVAASGMGLFLYPLATESGVIAGGIGVVLAYVVARITRERGLRTIAGLVIAGI